ncbi:MAG: type II toxin-antitoxin system RelE/ParE family toxin [Gammaproteobacteria bacterium]|nr:type II toxin-antitoxin system RelE/ParE family toxin [Gammaproteobacteria bacterium]
MPRYDVTRQAMADLRDIVRYTMETWGRRQARLYREELELGIQKLALSPGLGRMRTDVAPSVQSFPIARHVAFYVESESGITVLRVLHPGMDVTRAFPDEV